ncbi:MAG: Nucleotidyltransferase domain protein [Candidatus Bathyarchaeota archaeon BA1]|nr:MAG: Nucleotidyltransferase domain protein [Candidatus Bathyarchaeota archaeon BA1]
MGKSVRAHKKHDFGVSEEGFDVAISIEKYKDILLKSPIKVGTIIVMGSRARGDWKPWSDVDVLVNSGKATEGLVKIGCFADHR